MLTELFRADLIDNGISTTPEAMELASNLHSELSVITIVNTPQTQALATEAGRNAQGFLKTLEASRKYTKQPVLDIGRKIDALADELAAPVKEEMNRVGQLVARFQTAEAARVKAEADAKAKADREAMEAKFAADRAAEIAEGKIQTDDDLQKAIALEAEAKARQVAMYHQITKPAPAAIKAAGSVTKKVLRFEVTDMKAAYAARPELFTVEPKLSAINATCTEDSKVPGMRFWSELSTSFRR
jgi:hypothetical protein